MPKILPIHPIIKNKTLAKILLASLLLANSLIFPPATAQASSIYDAGPWTTSGTNDTKQWVLSGDPRTGGYEFDVKGLDNSSWDSVSRDVYTLASVFDGTRSDDAGNEYYMAIWMFGPNWFPDHHGQFRLRVNMNNQTGDDNDPNAYEEDTRTFNWDPNKTYHVKLEWDTSRIFLYIDGVQEQGWDYSHTGEEFIPEQTVFRLGAMHWGSAPNLTYSNISAWIGDYKDPVCGDGVPDVGEECDDGNLLNGDGCSSICLWEHTCGNGMIEHGEECDDGNLLNGDGCSSQCTNETPNPVCGNGTREQGEDCDDGNTVSGDGCSSTCQIENNLTAPSLLETYETSPSQAELVWQDNSSSEGGFKIERYTTSWNQIATVNSNTTTYTNTNLSPSTSYSYRVRAYEGADNSAYSNTSTITMDANSGNVDLNISNINAASGKDYFSSYVREGNPMYLDRIYTVTSIPSEYQGLLWVKTANNDKLTSSPTNFLTYTIDRNSTVYVGYDTRLSLPSWLSNWTNTGNTITNSDTAGKNTFRLYSREFSAGTVNLGPNTAGTNSSNMYIVLNKNVGGGPVCGNNNLEIGEECDDGNLLNGDGCSSTCEIEPECGDGKTESPEQCDDGNLLNGDGCSSTCNLEPGASPFIGISEDKFTINGRPTFLLGVSMFDALNWSDSQMESDLQYLKDNQYNLIRVWADWSWQNNKENDHSSWTNRNSTVYNLDASLNSNIDKLKSVIEKAGQYGIIVDVTIEDTNPWFYGDGVNFNDRLAAATNITNALKGYDNIFFDINNEHDHSGTDFYPISHSEAKQIADRVRAADPNRLLTISSTGKHIIDSSGNLQTGNINAAVLDIGVDLMAPHFYRSSDWYSQTTTRVTDLKNYLSNNLAKNLPVYLQEENYYPGGDSSSSHFVDAATDAKNAQAAGWIFHQVAGFDLKNNKSFYNELGSSGRNALEAIGDAVGVAPTIAGDTDNDGDVDIFDYNTVVSNFGATNCGNAADTDLDCDVDIFDYNTVVSNFGLSN